MMSEGRSVSNLAPIVQSFHDGDIDAFKRMLDRGEDVNATDNRDGLSVLMLAGLYNDEEFVDALFDHHDRHQTLDFDLKSNFGANAVAVTFLAGHKALALKMLRYEMAHKRTKGLAPPAVP
jgi:ankyrin repeat protein